MRAGMPELEDYEAAPDDAMRPSTDADYIDGNFRMLVDRD